MSIIIDGIVGARPNMMKMAPLAKAIKEDGTFELRLIHTGQHYDTDMSDVFFRQLGLPKPSFNLEVGSGTHGKQTALIIERYENILLNNPKPKGVILVGDVNSTLACAVAASKLNIQIAHIEAGLRSFDRNMPEEINRIVTDSISDLLFVTDPDGLINLSKEGHTRESIKYVGNLMIDTLYAQLAKADKNDILNNLSVSPKEYIYLTMHRPSNVDDVEILQNLVGCIKTISSEIKIVWALHPRTKDRLADTEIDISSVSNIIITRPLDYLANLKLIKEAKAILSDSGGIQEEASVLNTPCLTMRNNTERPVTVELGSSELVGNDPIKILNAFNLVMEGKWKSSTQIPLWDGHTAERIIKELRLNWN